MTNHSETLKQGLDYLTSHKNVFHQVVYPSADPKDTQKELKEQNYPVALETKHTNEQE